MGGTQQTPLHRTEHQHQTGVSVKDSAARAQVASMRQGQAEAVIPMRTMNGVLCERKHGQPGAPRAVECLPVIDGLGRHIDTSACKPGLRRLCMQAGLMIQG